jgi:hypothetical protein
MRFLTAFVCLAVLACPTTQAAPPFGGTIFIDPDIITSSDPTTFTGMTYAGQGWRTMYDRRVGWTTRNAYLFDADYSDGLTAEIQVNPEFGSAEVAEIEANKYGIEIGRLPTVLRSDVRTVSIHQGVNPFGGGNNNILIHTGQANAYSASGILEETLVHEAAHTSLDADHRYAAGWVAAQAADPDFISTYAQNNPTREDIAESFLPYLAVRYRAERISTSLADTITATIPNRIAYFDDQGFNMFPIFEPQTPGDTNGDGIVDDSDITNLVAQFGGPPDGESADFNGDNFVDLADFAVLRGNLGFGAEPPAPDDAFGAGIPEPATMTLLALGALSLPKRGGLAGLRRGRRRS